MNIKKIKEILEKEEDLGHAVYLIEEIDKKKELKVWDKLYDYKKLNKLKNKIDIISLLIMLSHVSYGEIDMGLWFWSHKCKECREDTDIEHLDQLIFFEEEAKKAIYKSIEEYEKNNNKEEK